MAGDTLILHASSSECSLFMEAELVERLSGMDTELTMEDLEEGCGEDRVFYVERGDLLRLNDCEYMTACQSALRQVIAAIKGGGGKEKKEEEEIEEDKEEEKEEEEEEEKEEEEEEEKEEEEKEEEEKEEESGGEAECAVVCMHQGLSVLGLTAAKLGED